MSGETFGGGTVILDYGMGNLRSVEKAIEALGHPVRVAPEIGDADRLIIPGVGAFGAAMTRLAPLREEIRAFAAAGKPVLGICLGQQLLFERSEEFGSNEGLGLLAGEVKYLPSGEGRKIPLIGWSEVAIVDEVLGRGIRPNDQFYFVHSLYTEAADPGDVAMTAEYGRVFPAAVRRDNVWGMQFHPEKSGEAGLKLLRNFLESPC